MCVITQLDAVVLVPNIDGFLLQTTSPLKYLLNVFPDDLVERRFCFIKDFLSQVLDALGAIHHLLIQRLGVLLLALAVQELPDVLKLLCQVILDDDLAPAELHLGIVGC